MSLMLNSNFAVSEASNCQISGVQGFGVLNTPYKTARQTKNINTGFSAWEYVEFYANVRNAFYSKTAFSFQ